MTALVSNLALDSKNAVSIVESGGVESILRGLGNVGTAKTSSVALARLADTPLNAQRIVEANGVERLTEIVGLSGESAESFVASESALGARPNWPPAKASQAVWFRRVDCKWRARWRPQRRNAQPKCSAPSPLSSAWRRPKMPALARHS